MSSILKSLGRTGLKGFGKFGLTNGKNLLTAGKGVAGLSMLNLAGVEIPIISDVFNSVADLFGAEVGQGGLIEVISNNPNLLLIAIITIFILINK